MPSDSQDGYNVLAEAFASAPILQFPRLEPARVVTVKFE